MPTDATDIQLIDLGLLIVRIGFGLIFAAHGAQKLFGWFGGPGIAGTSGWLESSGYRPARVFATMLGLTEFSGTAAGSRAPRPCWSSTDHCGNDRGNGD